MLTGRAISFSLMPVAILTGGDKGLSEKDIFSPSSTFLSIIEYDVESKALDITFHNGLKKRYTCEPSTYQAFKSSPNHSVFYSRLIKKILPSVTIIDTGIGTNKSSPIKKVKQEKNLNVGLRQQQAKRERIWGTVDRALNAAVVNS